jgi:hypothetical protein
MSLARRRRRTAKSATTSTSENNSILAGRDPAGSSKHQTTGGSAAAAIKGLFSAAKALLCRKDEDEPPPPARRSGETEKGFIMAVRRRYDRLRETHRAVTRGGSGKAFGEAANAALLAAQMPEDLPHVGGGYGADLFDPASAYWQDNANNDQWHDGNFNAKQDQYFPQP